MRSTITSETEIRTMFGKTVYKLTSEAVDRIANTINRHPRFNQLFTGLDGLYAWSDRAQQYYLSEIDRIGPTKARLQIRRIVNEVALIA